MINWEEQWAIHAPDFRNGLAHIENLSLVLEPGPGFGDFSHPTTRLVVSLMTIHVLGEEILDIGCGTGILSLAALRLGAKGAMGFDIDPEAVLHARKNAKLNDLPATFHESSVKADFKSSPVALMNMIFSEQKMAWAHFSSLKPKKVVTSGILSEQREEYLEWASAQGWKLLQEDEEKEWKGFLFLT